MILGLILQTKRRSTLFYLSYTVFSGVVVAVIDEAIQLFSDGRGALVQDILLDACGTVTGIVVITLIGFLRRKLRKNNERSRKQ